MANSNNWGEIYKSTWWGDKAWSANTLFIDSAPPGFGLNLLKASEDMNITLDWSQTLISVAANSTDEAAPNGTDTAEKLTFTDNRQSRIQQQIALEANTTYTFSVYAKVRTGTKAFRLRNVTLGQAQQFTADTDWGLNPDDGRYSFSFTTGATAITHTLSIQNAASAGTGEVFFWGAMLNEGATAGDYVKTDASVGGSAPTPAYSGFGDAFGGATAYYSLRKFTEAETLNAIRVRRSSDDTEQDIGFDANGDLDTTALTEFVGSENLFFPSETFTGWGNIGGSTITSNTTETDDPFGGSNATKVTSGSFVLIYKGAFTNVIRTQTFYAKAGTAETFGMYFGSGFNANFNISADSPSVTSTNNTTATITAVGNGWYRCSATLTSVPSGNYFAGVNFSPTSGTTFYIFGAQLEGGTTATTYNKTTTDIGGDGAVTTWYDQSGNGNDATNINDSEQPLVVSGGTLVEENGKAAINADGTNVLQTATGVIGSISSLSAFSVIKYNVTGADNDMVYGITSSAYGGTDDNFFFRQLSGDFESKLTDATQESTINLSTADTSQYLFSQLFVGGSKHELVKNGTSTSDTTNIPSTLNLSQELEIFSVLGTILASDMKLQELIVFNSDQSSNRTGMETNINDHFDIYTP